MNIPTTSQVVTCGEIRAPWHHSLPVVSDVTAQVRGSHVSQLSDPPRLIDTPGAATLFPESEEEIIASEALQLMKPDAILFVADAKNLRRSMALFIHVAQFGLPMVVALNMVDEARLQGTTVDAEELQKRIGVPVVPTVAVYKKGVHEVARRLVAPAVPELAMPDEGSGHMVARLASLLKGVETNHRRGLALMLLAGDPTARQVLDETLDDDARADVEEMIASARASHAQPLELVLTDQFNAAAERLVAGVVHRSEASPGMLNRLGLWAQHPLYGLPVALLVVALMYYLVGVIGATIVVDWVSVSIFDAHLIPLTEAALQWIPWPLLYDALMDPDFGLLPTGLFLAIGLVFPVLLFFYLAFAILQDSGYLPRLSVLMDRLFRLVGLNGKGVLPLAMGFSCVTMALITTRMLQTRRERIIASFLLMLAVPCAPLLGVMLVILGPMPVAATVTVFGIIWLQAVVAGMLAAKLVPGRSGDFILEIPPMRIPRVGHVLTMTWRNTWLFMKEAVPYFMLATFVLFIFDRIGGLDFIKVLSAPLVEGFLGLPDTTVQVFIKTFIRRENGAAELDRIRLEFTNLQLIVTLLVMTFLVPCVNAVMVLYKERGGRVATIILGLTTVYALVLGAVVNHGCRLLGITFGG
jgi:ferrous iron transport protein B